MDAFRTKRVQDATSASTFSCLMEHVITFRRLQQTAECLLTTPPPPLSAILKCAEQTRDTGLQEPIHVCGPLLAPVMSLCAAAIQQYTKGAAQLELAVHIVSAAPNTIIDIGGIHSNGKLIARSKDPQALLDAAIIHREAFGWRPTPTQTATSFVQTLDESVSAIGGVADAIARTMKCDHTTLKAQLLDRASPTL